jgi:hypothetical protein
VPTWRQRRKAVTSLHISSQEEGHLDVVRESVFHMFNNNTSAPLFPLAAKFSLPSRSI